MKKAFIIFTIFSLYLSGFAEKTEFDSKQVFQYSRQISNVAKDEIWSGFDMTKYTTINSKDHKSSLNFRAGDTFSWTLDDDYFLTHRLDQNVMITFHEAFHAFQRDVKRPGLRWGSENSYLVFQYQESSARNNALFRIESQILNLGLQTKSKKHLRERIGQFLAVRKLRQSELPQEFVGFEKGAELNEGLAEYVGTKAILVALGKIKKLKIPFETSNTKDFLRNKFAPLNEITGLGKNVRLKFYYTGSAQGLLLDRLGEDWKMKVQMEGANLQDLLESAVGKKNRKTDSILSEYDRLLEHEKKRVAQRNSDNLALLEKTLNQKGRKVIIDYLALKSPGQIRYFDPMNVTMINPKLRIHTRSVSFSSKSAFTADFSQSVVEDLQNKRYTTILEPNIEITADGEPIDLVENGEYTFGRSLKIASEGFKLEATKGKIQIEDGKVLVVLWDKAQGQN